MIEDGLIVDDWTRVIGIALPDGRSGRQKFFVELLE